MMRIRVYLVLYLVVFATVSILHAQLVDNGDGTITDTASGLMWTKDAKLPGSSNLTYAEAVAWVSALDYAGHTDWRLPAGIDPRNDPNGSTPDSQYYYDCSSSEFGGLFYTVLSGTGGLKITEMWNPSYQIVPNDDPDLPLFENILGVSSSGSIFWTGIPKDASNTWTFSFWAGSYKGVASGAGSTYRLRVWPVREASGGGGGEPEPGSNQPPTHFATLDGYDGAVPLAWGKPSDMTGLLGYDVHRYTMQGAHTKLADQIQNQYFRDESVVNGTSYNYTVRAVYTSGESDLVPNILGTPVEDGYTLPCGDAESSPTLDGHIQSAEWISAQTINITYPGVSPSVTLYAMNDHQTLYIGVDDPGDNTLDSWDGIGIIFDEDLDREWPPTNNGQEGILQIFWNGSTTASQFQAFYGTWPDEVHGSDWSMPTGLTHQISTASGHVQIEVGLDLSTSPFNGSGGDVLGVFFYSLDASSGFHGAWPQECANHLLSMTSGNAWAHGAFSFGDLTLSEYSDVDDRNGGLPESVVLEQNYPNPFNASTTIRYHLDRKAVIDLTVYDLNGKVIETLTQGLMKAGSHTCYWDTGNLPSGIYLCRLKTGGSIQTTKLILQK